jgi:hypothetical protein
VAIVTAAKRYFVHFTGAKKKGSTKRRQLKEVYGPYTLKSAKDYARIASQYGDPTEIYRDDEDLVRRYVRGQRQWPIRPRDADQLMSSEIPKRLAVGGPGGNVQVRIRRLKNGMFTVDTVSPKHDQRIRWAIAQSTGQMPKGPLAVVSGFSGADEVPPGGEIHIRVPAQELQQLVDVTHGTHAFAHANPRVRIGRKWYPNR